MFDFNDIYLLYTMVNFGTVFMSPLQVQSKKGSLKWIQLRTAFASRWQHCTIPAGP